MEGKRRIMLGSNNYLGLTENPEIIQAGVDALKTFGTGVSGSRFMNGTLTMHLELERELASLQKAFTDLAVRHELVNRALKDRPSKPGRSSR